VTPKSGMLLTEEEIGNLWGTYGPGRYYGTVPPEAYQAAWREFARRIEAAVLNRWIAWLDTAEGDIDFVAFMMKKAAAEAEKEASDGE